MCLIKCLIKCLMIRQLANERSQNVSKIQRQLRFYSRKFKKIQYTIYLFAEIFALKFITFFLFKFQKFIVLPDPVCLPRLSPPQQKRGRRTVNRIGRSCCCFLKKLTTHRGCVTVEVYTRTAVLRPSCS